MIKENEVIDRITYQSWKAQIELYGMSYENARKLYKNAKAFEKIYIDNKKMELTNE